MPPLLSFVVVLVCAVYGALWLVFLVALVLAVILENRHTRTGTC